MSIFHQDMAKNVFWTPIHMLQCKLLLHIKPLKISRSFRPFNWRKPLFVRLLINLWYKSVSDQKSASELVLYWWWCFPIILKLHIPNSQSNKTKNGEIPSRPIRIVKILCAKFCAQTHEFLFVLYSFYFYYYYMVSQEQFLSLKKFPWKYSQLFQNKCNIKNGGHSEMVRLTAFSL